MNQLINKGMDYTTIIDKLYDLWEKLDWTEDIGTRMIASFMDISIDCVKIIRYYRNQKEWTKDLENTIIESDKLGRSFIPFSSIKKQYEILIYCEENFQTIDTDFHNLLNF